MSESFADLFEESVKQTEMRTGAMLVGIVVDIDNDKVIVSAGLKSEGVIPKWQFLNDEGDLEVSVGDEVEVALDLIEDGLGATLLSRDKAKKHRAWGELEAAFEAEETITGRINGKVRGGFTVAVGALRAFLPGSLVDVRPIRDTTFLEGRDLEFKVIKIDQKRNNVVLSRRAVVEKEYSAERDELLKTLADGIVVKGIVKNLTDYGAFIDLGGIDGLLHITDMAWRRVRHPSECVEIGQEIEVKVLKFDKEKTRVSLGMKQMAEDPWHDIANRYPAGTRVSGKVNNLTDYGCFVEIEEGVEGLVHVSEMDWTNKNVNPSKVVQLGDPVEIMILEIDEERRRISLGMKQCRTNPWDEFAATHNKGDKISGKIKSITDFGIFIGLDGNIDGLVHMSDISWSDGQEDSIREYQKGDEVETVILAVDAERERISLGIKQLQQDPFQNYIAINEKGSMVKGIVKEVDAKGAVITLAENIEGYLRASEIQRDRVEDATKLLSVGDEVEAKFIGVDKKNKSISLSIKAKDSDAEASVMKEYSEAVAGTPTMGDLFKQLDK
ncbi:MAG: 30S ribosomal protein S1 [Gammaproteobacteria bacterium]|jgi:small subunit ribosomal protein S1|nr:30S ribosomal protein S1 [Gammaproteobacteria bacterium]MBT4146190.1 30S ribosomal protein S1 [Gammaproteobacteria bacterium]MBT5221921.1 30S ribosomal protein S1 [Gammaproteobacteria bacterium]MBT5824947.1 30S ribosomal protein S1 [Gammaproteobacteria bacterium]MBT5967638.1 30S ribosomal protein S1 [Gammaproteobacteria bacterium]